MEKAASNPGNTEGNNKENTAPKTSLKTRPSSVPLSVRQKKEAVAGKLRKKQKTELDDVFSIEVMKCFSETNDKKEATELFRTKELQRHHKAMEDLAEREQKLKEQQSDFDFKVKRLEQYHQLKSKFEPGFIAAVFPEMKVFIDAENIINVGPDSGNDSSVNMD
jgi:predicted nuclease with TOPRIM domain